MALKTPEQIADAHLSDAFDVTAHGNTALAPLTWWGVRDQIVAAIEADRAQREVVEDFPTPQVAWTKRRADQIKPDDILQIDEDVRVRVLTIRNSGGLVYMRGARLDPHEVSGDRWNAAFPVRFPLTVQVPATDHTKARHARAEIMGVKPEEA